jgi:hypothetical protein
MDALRLEVEMLRRCLIRLYPDFNKCLATLRDEAQEINPEALEDASNCMGIGYPYLSGISVLSC